MTLTGDSEGARLIGDAHKDEGFDQALRAYTERKLAAMNQRIENSGYVPAGAFARAYARLGQNEKAFDWLKKAVEERNVFALFINVDPVYDTLRQDPRFEELLRRVTFIPNGDDKLRDGAPRRTKM